MPLLTLCRPRISDSVEAPVGLMRQAHRPVADAVVGEAQAGVVDRHVVLQPSAAAFVVAQVEVTAEAAEVEAADGDAAVEEQAVRLRAAPRALEDLVPLAVAGIALVLDRAGLELAGQLVLEVPLPVPGERDLVLARRLERQAAAYRAVGFLRLDRAIRVRRIEEVAHARIGKQVGDARRRAPSPGRGEEPHPVRLDRTAHRAVEVVHALDRVHRRQPLRAQVVVEVVALQAVAGAGDEERGVEPVAAVPGNAVDLRAAQRVLR